MKKTSTVATTSNQNLQRKLTIGLDLGDRSSWYCVLDDAGEVEGQRKLGTTPKAMNEVFATMPRCRVALETGTHSPWVSRLLSELGHEVIVAHARNVRLIGESRGKDDRIPVGISRHFFGESQHRCAGSSQTLPLVPLSSVAKFFTSRTLTGQPNSLLSDSAIVGLTADKSASSQCVSTAKIFALQSVFMASVRVVFNTLLGWGDLASWPRLLLHSSIRLGKPCSYGESFSDSSGFSLTCTGVWL